MVKKVKQLVHFLLAFGTYWYYGRPSRKMVVIGVTGTKGKSTTCRLVASVLEAGGLKVGMLSTVEFQIGEKRWMNDKKMTMLGRGQIQKMLNEMIASGCTHVVVETSSEGILQYRHYGLNFDVSVFTNLGTEHSERHGGYENLRRDKGKMFAALSKGSKKIIGGKEIPKIIIANADDKEAAFYLSYNADKKISYSLGKSLLEVHNDADHYVAVKGVMEEKGGDFVLENEKYHINLPGEFNVYNSLAAVMVGKALGLSSDTAKKGLQSVTLIPGRMEFIEEGQPFKIVVDYAHEEKSLEALFLTLRDIVKNGKIISVIGSDGGGRDVKKRSSMGEVSGRLTDIVMITDVNCFDEDPKEIAEMLAKGARVAGKKDQVDLFIEIDRKNAIGKAFSMAQKGDVVAITAKGTEPFICIAGGNKIPWDDRRMARVMVHEMMTGTIKQFE